MSAAPSYCWHRVYLHKPALSGSREAFASFSAACIRPLTMIIHARNPIFAAMPRPDLRTIVIFDGSHLHMIPNLAGYRFFCGRGRGTYESPSCGSSKSKPAADPRQAICRPGSRCISGSPYILLGIYSSASSSSSIDKGTVHPRHFELPVSYLDTTLLEDGILTH